MAKLSPLRFCTRLFVVAGLMLAWLAATNHCTLARWTAPAARAHRCCQGEKEQPRKDAAPACCKTLHGTAAPDRLQAPTADLALVLPVFSLTEVDGCQPTPTTSEVEYRPPRALSFAEAILQRSLLSHAPPLAA